MRLEKAYKQNIYSLNIRWTKIARAALSRQVMEAVDPRRFCAVNIFPCNGIGAL